MASASFASLKAEVEARNASELRNDAVSKVWAHTRGHLDVRRYGIMDMAELAREGTLSGLVHLMQTTEFARYLSALTGLDVARMSRPRVEHFGVGDYTMLTDDSKASTANNYSLYVCLYCHVVMDKDAEVWRVEDGGQTVFLSGDGSEELLTVVPEDNALAIAFVEPDVRSFVKYVSCRGGSERAFVRVVAHYFEDDENDNASNAKSDS